MEEQEAKKEETHVREANDNTPSEDVVSEASAKEEKERRHFFRELKEKLAAMDEDKKETIKTVGKVSAICALGIALVAVCSVSAINHVERRHAKSGTMISISEVSYGVDPFFGVTFGKRPVSYNEMLYNTYVQVEEEPDEFDQRLQELLAEYNPSEHVERTEAPVTTEAVADADEEIEIKDTSEPAVVDIDAAIAYNKQKNTTQAYVIVPGTPGQGAAATAPTGYTFADENGTYQDLGEFVLTAYCPCPICCGQWSNMENPSTASGNPAVEGVTIAVDTNVIPFGTRIKIGDHIYTAQDRGGAIKGNRIDVYFRTHERACQFGKQTMHVYKVIE